MYKLAQSGQCGYATDADKAAYQAFSEAFDFDARAGLE